MRNPVTPVKSPRAFGSRVVVLAGLTSVALSLQSCASAATSDSPAAQPVVKHVALHGSHAKIGKVFFGMHAPGAVQSYPKAKFGAMNLTANQLYWPEIETRKGHFDFRNVDAAVKNARAHHAQPLLILGHTPSFHSTTPHQGDATATVPKMKPWKHYVSKMVHRYHAKVDYQLWPEPNIVQNWGGSPQQLAKLSLAAAKIIHHASHSATIVAPAMVMRLKGQRRFMKKFYAAKVDGRRVGSVVDAVGIDPYPKQHGTPEDSTDLIAKAQAILHKYHVKAQLWNVEINYGVAGGGQAIKSHSSQLKQASYVTRTFVLNAASGIRRVYWLGWGRFPTMDVQMVQDNGVTPTRAGKAYNVVRSWLLGQRSSGCTQSKSGVYACKLVGHGHTSWVYWVPKGSKSVRVPKGVRRIETMDGKVSHTHAGKKVKVTLAPVYLHH